MFEHFGGTGQTYREQYRNLRSNLIDKNNIQLNYNFYKGISLPEAVRRSHRFFLVPLTPCTRTRRLYSAACCF